MSRPIETRLVGRPDPLQLPETAGVEVQPRPVLESAWLGWAAVSIVVAVTVAMVVLAVYPNLEGAIVVFGLGMAWSAATPRVLRAIGRRLHG